MATRTAGSRHHTPRIDGKDIAFVVGGTVLGFVVVFFSHLISDWTAAGDSQEGLFHVPLWFGPWLGFLAGLFLAVVHEKSPFSRRRRD